ncbi:hypothetical protein TWF506_004743 [Arthrobotrys conoides]|uniref:Uncharacterized protein n=1 Tax=Arthrobotrys conoides TaxID=74498 RepID=A0AAN8RI75_9PEZI
MPLPWKKDSKKASVPEEAPTLPPILQSSASLDEVKAAMDEVVARQASDEVKEGRLAAKGVELLGSDVFLFEGRVYRELSKGRWDATEVTPAELAALRVATDKSPIAPVSGPSPGRLMPAQEKKALEKFKTLFSKSSKGSGPGRLKEGRILKGKDIRVLQETAEGLHGGFIEKEKAARAVSPLLNPFVNAPSSSVSTLPQQSAGGHLTVDRSFVPHFASLRPSRSCVDLIPLNMASAQGGQGGTRYLSDVTVARREVFPPQNLCCLRESSQPGMFTLVAHKDTLPELLEVYFPEGSCVEITREIAMTLYRSLYDRVCNLESEGLETEDLLKSPSTSSRRNPVSKRGSSTTGDAVISTAAIKGKEAKLTKEEENLVPPSTLRGRAVIRSQSLLDAVIMGASSAMNSRKGGLNTSRKAEDSDGFMSILGRDDETFVNNENYAPDVNQDIRDQPSKLQAQESSVKFSAARTSHPINTTSKPLLKRNQHSSQAILGISPNSTYEVLPMNKPEVREVQTPIFELEAAPASSATVTGFPAAGSVENFVMTQGYQERAKTTGKSRVEDRSEPLGGRIVEREFNEIFPQLTGLALTNQSRAKGGPKGDFGRLRSAVSKGNVAEPALEHVPPRAENELAAPRRHSSSNSSESESAGNGSDEEGPLLARNSDEDGPSSSDRGAEDEVRAEESLGEESLGEGSLFAAESCAPLLEEEYEDVVVRTASSTGGRYWGSEAPVPRRGDTRNVDGSFRWPAAPRQRPNDSHTTRQRQQTLEQALRGQISLPAPLQRARQSPLNLSSRNISPSAPIGGQEEDFSYPPEAFVAPRPAPSPPSRNMVSTSPPQRSRLPTYGGRQIQSPESPGSTPPNRPAPAVSPRRGAYIPPATEVQVPPSRGSLSPRAAIDKVPLRNIATDPIIPQSESTIPASSTSSGQPIRQKQVSYSLFPPRPTGSGTSPRSKIPTRASTPMRKIQVEVTPTSPVSENSDSSLPVEKVTYTPVSDSSTAEVSTRAIQTLSQKQQPLTTAEISFKSVLESSSRFYTPSPIKDLPMSPIDSLKASQIDDVVSVSQAHDHTIYDASRNLNVSRSGVSRRPSPNISGSTRSSTPSRGGSTGAPDFASETPEQRGARHAANQAVYDRMNPVLRQARSGFDVVRDWVAENGGRMDQNKDKYPEFQQTEEFVEHTPEQVIPIVEKSTSVTDIPELSISSPYAENHHTKSEDTPLESGIKQSTSKLELFEAVASNVTEFSALSNTSESDISIASSDVEPSVSVVRRLRKKSSFYDLRAPQPVSATLRVTDDDFYDEIPTRLLDAITPIVDSFAGMGPPEGYLSDEEEDSVQDEMILDITEHNEYRDLVLQALPSDNESFSQTQEDFLDDFDADTIDLPYRASTNEETEAPIDTSMSLEPTSPEEKEEVIPEQHATVQETSTISNIPLYIGIDQEQLSQLHPLIAASYPWNPHFPGAEEEFGGPVVIIPPPTTADGYLNIQAYWSDGRPIPIVRHGEIDVENCYKVTEEEKKVEDKPKEQEQSVALPSAPQSSEDTVVEIAPEVPKPESQPERRGRSRSSLSRSSSQSHSRRHSVARKTRRTKAMHKLNMRPTVLSTILEEEEKDEGEDSNGRDSGESTRSSPASGIIQCQVTMSEWLLSTAILDDKGGIWIPPVAEKREFEVLAEFERLRKVRGRGVVVGVGSGLMVWGEEEEMEMDRHLLPLLCKKVAAEELERERRALLRRWEDSDISILEIPKEALGRLWDEETGRLRCVTELRVEEVDQIVRETQRSAEGDVMRRVKLEATTVGSSRWLRMSPLAKRRFVKFNLTDLKDRMALAEEVRMAEEGEGGRRRGYKGRRCSETFVVFEARRRRENHENAPPVLGVAVGRPRKEKRSLWTRCGEAVQGFFRAAVALSSQPKPKKEKVEEVKEERGYDVVRVGRGLRKVQRGDSSVIALRAPPTQVDEASDQGNQKRHRRKRSVVMGLLSPILPKVAGGSKVARKD